MRRPSWLCAVSFLLWVAVDPARADWVTDPTVNLPVTTAPARQVFPTSAPDGHGGVIVAWQDSRDSASVGVEIYAQRLDARGLPLWTVDGVRVATAAGNQFLGPVGDPVIAPDADGGAVIAFQHGQNPYRARLQKLTAGGVPLWGDSGIAMTSRPGSLTNPRVLPDGAGGALVSWEGVVGGQSAILAQHFDASGQELWAPGGVIVCVSIIPQDQQMVTDGSGGVILAWQDYRALPPDGSGDVYAQRVDAVGHGLWTLNGIPICVAASHQTLLAACGDGAGGTVVTWTDSRSGTNRAYAQRVSGVGIALWTPNGVPLSLAPGTQTGSQAVADGTGGAIFAWVDQRPGDPEQLFAQRVGPSGGRLWGDEGKPICTAATGQSALVVVHVFESVFALRPDDSGGAIASWTDARTGNKDIYAQRLDGNGNALWTLNGVLVCGAPGRQGAVTLVRADAGGSIIAWEDQRNGPTDLYAQRIGPSGELGGLLAVGQGPHAIALTLQPIAPQPSRGAMTFSFLAPRDGTASLVIHDVQGRRVRLLQTMAQEGANRLMWNGRDESGRAVGSGVYLAGLECDGARGTWRFVVVH